MMHYLGCYVKGQEPKFVIVDVILYNIFMHYSVSYDRPIGHVLANMWNVTPMAHEGLAQPFPADVSDGALFIASPDRTFDVDPDDLRRGNAMVAGKLLVPSITSVSDEDITVVSYPPDASPHETRLARAIERVSLDPGIGIVLGRGSGIDEPLSFAMLAEQVRAFTAGLARNVYPIGEWATIAASASPEEMSPELLNDYNQALPGYQRYAGFLLGLKGTASFQQERALGKVLDYQQR